MLQISSPSKVDQKPVVEVCSDAQAAEELDKELTGGSQGTEVPYFSVKKSRAFSIFVSEEESGSRKSTPERDLHHWSPETE